MKIYKKIKRIIEIIIAIIGVFFVLIILTQNISNNDKAFLGFRIFKVETGSMIPTYQIGDSILVKEKKIDEIDEGNDIAYIASSGVIKGHIITHRVIKKGVDEQGEKYVITQGIANSVEDPAVYEEQINGIVITKLYLLSLITKGFNNMYVLYFCIIIPITIYIFFNLLRSNRKEFEDKKG